MIGLALLAVAGALLVAGAELFVESAAGAARRLGVTVLAVGVLLAGAEPEELVTGVVGALRGRPGLAAGDAVGANITMLTLALGLAALLRPLPVGRRVRRYALASALAGALAVAAVAGGAVGRLAAAGLLAAYAAGVALVWRVEREPPALGELGELAEEAAAGSAPGGGDDGDGEGEGRGLLGVVAGIALMTGGGVLAVQGAERVVAALGRSDDAVGLTLLALATTAELLALAWAAARRGVGEVAVAGVVGSAAYNATATLGAAALARPLHGVGGLAGPAALAAVLPLAVVALAGVGGPGAGGGEWRLGRPAGALLVAAYTAYVAVTLH